MPLSQNYLRLLAARKATDKSPTAEEKEAGTYDQGKLTLHGMRIALENPKGSVRKGKDKSGKSWSSTMRCDYGYFTNTEAKDGDDVDVFIGPDLESEIAYVIDQRIDGKYDEAKVVLGCSSQEQATKLYLSNYQDGWKMSPITAVTVGQLKAWLKDGDTKSPFRGQMVKAAFAL